MIKQQQHMHMHMHICNRNRNSNRNSASTMRVCASASMSPTLETQSSSMQRPTSAEAARTLLQSQNHATLGTICEDGWPLTTYAGYVLDGDGTPILRMRRDAVHYANVQRDNRVSILVTKGGSKYAQQQQASFGLARCTVLGHVTDDIPEKDLEKLIKRYRVDHVAAHGVDAPRESDVYMRLNIEKVFYVGGLGTDARAEFVCCDDFKQAEPDPLHAIYDTLISDLNSTSLDELMIVANEFIKTSHGEGQDSIVTSCRLAHIDKLGIDLHTVRAHHQDNEVVDIRIPFRLPVQTESEARSTITMMAQHAWEQDKKYIPPSIVWDISDENDGDN